VVFGEGVSDRTTDLPDASWPVTMRRGTLTAASSHKPRSLTRFRSGSHAVLMSVGHSVGYDRDS
jgi:hypothetical protein